MKNQDMVAKLDTTTQQISLLSLKGVLEKILVNKANKLDELIP